MKVHMAAVMVMLAVVLGSAWISAQELSGNPKRGQMIYEQHCLRCHGAAGDGLGPDVRDLIVPPANFQSPRSRVKSDTELLGAISNGVLFSPMHGWRGRLTDEQMRDVLSYIRLLAPFYPVS